jgi:hypothetical protein
MAPISGDFLYRDEGGLYIPREISIHKGWGNSVSIHIVGPDEKPLPDRMQLTFYSYLEDKFYRGEFLLPYDRIRELFARGYSSYDTGKLEKTTFNEIVAGMAPGGVVAVWVVGIDRQYEVFFGHAKQVELDWHQVFQLRRIYDRKEEVELELQSAAKFDPLVNVYREKIPFGLWESYRKRFSWAPMFEGNIKHPDRITRMSFYNGERDVFEFPLDDKTRDAARPVPSYMNTLVGIGNSRHRSLDVVFDEVSTRAAFERMGETGKPFHLVFHVNQQGEDTWLTIFVRNEQLTIELKSDWHAYVMD